MIVGGVVNIAQKAFHPWRICREMVVSVKDVNQRTASASMTA